MFSKSNPIVECVLNFSEGREQRVINTVQRAIQSVAKVELLNTDISPDANRTVVTFAGYPNEIKKAAYNAIKTIAGLIDMRKQGGAHPRIGAADVCPIVPIANVSMEEAVDLSHELGAEVGMTLNIPVYMYEFSAKNDLRKSLPNIRKGQYEGFAKKMKQPEWQPDYGPTDFNTKTGAIVIGARNLLIAFNVSLSTKDIRPAQDIAGMIRESGSKEKHPGKFKRLRSFGWYMPSYGCAQVSMNITDADAAPLHEVFETVRAEAAKRNIKVTGSELIGLLSLQVLLDAGKYFSKNKKAPKKDLIKIAVKKLLLDKVRPFDPKERILEWAIYGDTGVKL